MQNLQQNRDAIFPKVQEVNFADDVNNDYGNTNDLYNDILKKRETLNNFNQEQDRFGTFDNYQKSINNEINSFADKENENKIINEKATPIDMVLNEDTFNIHNQNNEILMSCAKFCAFFRG